MDTIWIVGVVVLVAWLIYRLAQKDKDVMYYQYIGGPTFIIRRDKVNIFVTRYRIYSAFTFRNPGEAATKQRFYFFSQARKWILDRRGTSALRAFSNLGDFKFGIAREGMIMPIPGDQWKGETVLARHVEKGARLEYTVQDFFRYWLGRQSVKGDRLA